MKVFGKKRLNPAQYEGMIDNMKKRIMQLQAQNRGLRELVDSMDAVLLEIAKKYGECQTEETVAPVWYLTFPIPDVSKLRKGQVLTMKDGGEYKVLAMSEEAMDAAAKLATEEREAQQGGCSGATRDNATPVLTCGIGKED